MSKRERPTMVRPSVSRRHGVAGWLNANVIEPGTEGIPQTPDVVDFAPQAEAPTPVVVMVDQKTFRAESELPAKRRRSKK